MSEFEQATRAVRPLRRALILALLLCTCSSNESTSISSGAMVEDGKYSNSYFGMSLSIPDGWSVASKDSEAFMREVGESAFAGDDPALHGMVEASKQTTYQLLTVSQHEMGAPVEFNPNLILMAERVSHVPGIKTGSDYLFHTQQALMKSKMPFELVKETYSTQLGAHEWYRFDLLLNQPQMPIDQAYFSVKRNDYVLSVILSAASPEQMSALEQIATTIAFD